MSADRSTSILTRNSISGRVLPLRGQRARIRGAKFDPFGELAFGTHIFGVDSEPSLHRPPTHFHQPSVRRRHERVRLCRVDANQYSTLAACGHFHVAADEKREPAEHLLLGQTGFAGDQFAYASREFLVVRHCSDRTTKASGPERAATVVARHVHRSSAGPPRL